VRPRRSAVAGHVDRGKIMDKTSPRPGDLSAQDVLEQACLPAPPTPPPEKKGARRPMGIQRKAVEAEQKATGFPSALCTSDARPIATPGRRPRSQGNIRCPSPHF
jgi:hypothetical protein